MAEKKDQNIFQGLLDVLRQQKGLDDKNDSHELLGPVKHSFTPKGSNNREEVQQQFLDWQVQKIASDIYSRAIYFDTDRISAYQDYEAMDHSPEIKQALSIMRDECLTKNEYGEILQVYSDQERVKEVLKDLFFNKLNINFMLKLWLREMLKFGDYFVYLQTDKDQGVVNVTSLPVGEVHREEGYDQDLGAVRFRWEGSSNLYLEEWQVAHFRLLEDTKRLPYGRSCLDAARKTWKQLQLATDAMLVYRLCLAGETRIKTDTGYKYIKDLREGDTVVTFNTDATVEYTKVLHQVNNGSKKTLRIRSKTHEIIATETHPILVRDGFIVKYVEAKDLIPKRHQLINPDLSLLPIKRKKIDLDLHPPFAFLNENGRNEFKSLENGSKLKRERELALSHSYDFGRIHQFLYAANKSIPVDIAEAVCEEFDLDKEKLVYHNKGFNKVRELNLPEYVDEEFARLFGFLLGDGYVRQFGVGFAEGMDKDVNDYYVGLLKKFFGKCVYEPERREGKTYGKYIVHSAMAAKIFRNLGFITGAHNKRIPDWVFTCEPEIRKAMVLGFSDADGCERFTKSRHKSWFSTIAICNKKLLEDIKELWSSLGFASGHIATKHNKACFRESLGRIIKATTSYILTISEQPLPEYENVWSVEKCGKEDVYDITVESKNHNFIANGTPVHNTRASDRKVFYIEVGNLAEADVKQFMHSVQRAVKKAPVVDIRNGNKDFKYNPQNVTEDYFLPVRGEHHSKIDTLPGASNMDQISDLEFLENKLFCALVVPKAYLNYTEGLQGGTTLSQSDIRFARTINGFQEVVLMELKKIATVHLYMLGYKDELNNFELQLNNPSTQLELMKLEIMKAQLEVGKEWCGMEANSPASWTWVQENIYGRSKNQIKQILKQKKIEKKLFAEIDSAPETYKKTGMFKDLDQKYEIAGADPNGGNASEEGGGEDGGFGGSSSLGTDGAGTGMGGDGGGGAPDVGGMDSGSSGAGGSPSPVGGSDAGGQSAPEMALGEGKISLQQRTNKSDDLFEGMMNELFEDDEKEERKKTILSSDKQQIAQSSVDVMAKTETLFRSLQNKFGEMSMTDRRKRKEMIKETLLTQVEGNPLLGDYNEQMLRLTELIDKVDFLPDDAVIEEQTDDIEPIEE